MPSLTTTIVTSLFSLGLVGGAFASEARAEPPGAQGHHGKGKVERLCKRLECTDNQLTKIKAIGKKLREAGKADHQAMRNLKSKLADEIAKDKPNRATLGQIYNQMDRHHDALQKRGQAALLETHALLTSEQRVELAEIIEHRGPRGIFGGHGKHGKKGKRGKHGKKGKRGKEGKRVHAKRNTDGALRG